MKKVFAFLAIAAMVMVSCGKTPTTPTVDPGTEDPGTEQPEEKVYEQPIIIDGEFADWAKLPADKVKVGKTVAGCAEGWDAVKEIRCYSDDFFVFYYIEYDAAQIDGLLAATVGADGLPIRLCINTDGEFTSGYASYFAQAYDFIIEGSLANEGAWTSFDGTLHQRIDGWVALQEGGLCTGAGKDNKYEICLMRDIFNAAAMTSTVTMPMGEIFHTGIRFYTPDWGELSNVPNSVPNPDSEVKAEQKGWGDLLEIHTVPVEE